MRELVDRVPLAIALASRDGTVEFVNKVFSETYDHSVLALGELAPFASRPAAESPSLRLPRHDGREVEAKVRAIEIHDGVMLVVSESPIAESQPELEALRSRIAELERLSSTDGLTGLWNRTHLDRIIAFELSRTLRFRQPISLILVDVDHFKEVNDSLGHQVGDAVLRELVDVLRANLRPSDVLFRWGGDELLMLSIATGYRAGEALAERLRGAVHRHRFATVGSGTVSIGVAEYLAPESAETWFARADGALYAAKKAGRNRVYVDRRGNSDQWSSETGVSALQLIWQEAYECGEPAIDEAHRELFELGNAVIAAVMVPTDPGTLNAALGALLAHVARHFADEEALLERVGYPRLEAHRQAHAALLTRSRELKAAADGGTANLGRLVDYVANDVVARHVFTMDRDFFPYVGRSAAGRVGARRRR